MKCYVTQRLDTKQACQNDATQFTPEGKPICDECIPQYNKVANMFNHVAIKINNNMRLQPIIPKSNN